MDSQDKKLDHLLGDVPIPADLKSSLMQISQQAELETEFATPNAPGVTKESTGKPNGFSATTTWLAWVLAASIVGAAAFYFLPTTKIENVKQLPNDTQTPREPGLPQIANSEDSLTANPPLESDSLAEFNQAQELIEQVRLTIENEMLRQKIAALKNNASDNPYPVQTALSNRQTESIIASLASQSRLEWGGDEKQIRLELESVIEKYPETKGAAFANTFLKNNKL